MSNYNDLLEVLTDHKKTHSVSIFESTDSVSILNSLRPEYNREATVLERIIESGKIRDLKRIGQIANKRDRQREISEVEKGLQQTELIPPSISDNCIQALLSLFIDERLDNTRQGESETSSSPNSSKENNGDCESDGDLDVHVPLQSEENTASKVIKKANGKNRKVELILLILLDALGICGLYFYNTGNLDFSGSDYEK